MNMSFEPYSLTYFLQHSSHIGFLVLPQTSQTHSWIKISLCPSLCLDHSSHRGLHGLLTSVRSMETFLILLPFPFPQHFIAALTCCFFHCTCHYLTNCITYFLLFIFCPLLLKCNVHEDKDLCYFLALIYSQSLRVVPGYIVGTH